MSTAAVPETAPAAAAATLATAGATVLVLGAARSGKSEWAERLAHDHAGPVTYLATAREDPSDAEWCARIAAHQARRPPDWQTHDAPTELAAAIAGHAVEGRCVLVDSLGTWVANLLELDEDAWQDQVEALQQALATSAGLIVLVGEETGWGLVPADALARRFRDRLGALLRRLGPRCAATWLVVGGYALDLAQLGTPLD